MNTILITNAVSSLLATAGISTYLLRKQRRLERETVVRPVYVTTGQTRTGHGRTTGR